MRLLTKSLFILICICTSNILFADTNVSVFAGYRSGGEFEVASSGEKLQIRENESTGFSVDWADSKNTMYEVVYSHQEAQLTNTNAPADVLIDLDIDYLHLGGIYLWPGKRAQPYLVGTLGITHFSPESGGYGNETRASIGFGLGSRVKLSERLGFNFEVRSYSTFLNSGGAMFCGDSGCRIIAASDTLWQYEFKAGLIFKF